MQNLDQSDSDSGFPARKKAAHVRPESFDGLDGSDEPELH